MLTHIAGGPCYRTVAAISRAADGTPCARAADGSEHRLSASEQLLLQRCADFFPLGKLRELDWFRESDMQRLLSAGLLERDLDILQRCAARAAPARLAPITDLAILTCGSPQLLERAVGSWSAFARKHGRELRLLVTDDSPTPQRAEPQRLMASRLQHDLGIALRFIDPQQRAALALEIAGLAGVDADLVGFAVAGCPPPRVGIGGNRNLIALLTQGRRFLSADDDIIAEFERPPAGPVALWVAAEMGPMNTYHYASAQALGSQVALSQEPDALGLHEAYVGHTVAEVVAGLQGAACLEGAGDTLTQAIQQEEMRIAATALGLAGDSASDCLAFYSLLSAGESARSFFSLPPLSPSREVLRRHPFAVLCQGVYLMTFCHAVDNTLPLPPYFPVGRGEDQVWQKLLHWSLPHTVVANLPLAVRHRPLSERQYRRSDYLDPCRFFHGNAFLLGVLSTCPPPDARLGADERLAHMGRHLAFVAQSAPRFDELLHGAWRAYLQHHRGLVARSLASEGDRPQWWYSSLRGIQRRLEEQLAAGGEVPLEYASRMGAPAAVAMRPDLARFGQLLQAWPAVRRAGRQLAERLGAEQG